MHNKGIRRALMGLGALAMMGPGLAVMTAAPAFASSTGAVDAAKAGPAASIERAAAARLATITDGATFTSSIVHPDTTVSLAEDSKLNCNGAAGGAEAKFNDGVISYGANSGQVYGDSYGYWWGGSPVNASTLILTDTYQITGAGTGWNSPGSSYKVLSSGTLQYSATRTNVWEFHHGEYEVTWGGFATWFSQSTAVDLEFPGTSCSPDASGTKYM